jgi:hypothetical protein
MTGLFAANRRFAFSFFSQLGYRTSMTETSGASIPFPDNDIARTRRQLRFVKALFKIDDPELEQALTVIMERLAADQPASIAPPSEGPRSEPP